MTITDNAVTTTVSDRRPMRRAARKPAPRRSDRRGVRSVLALPSNGESPAAPHSRVRVPAVTQAMRSQ